MKYLLFFIVTYLLYKVIIPRLKGSKRDKVIDSDKTMASSEESVNIREEDILDADFEELDE
ncbi:MAG: hypothetical protein IIB44_01905 [Candidatus Marinimicrobia bacterium]|nr:hypothetical protein [Candidatus Neomarinimicrobiota bacterium]MCH8069000.1 hypothetical protein [Candidatus Neomarinimicrobiota bacterium]